MAANLKEVTLLPREVSVWELFACIILIHFLGLLHFPLMTVLVLSVKNVGGYIHVYNSTPEPPV